MSAPSKYKELILCLASPTCRQLLENSQTLPSVQIKTSAVKCLTDPVKHRDQAAILQEINTNRSEVIFN